MTAPMAWRLRARGRCRVTEVRQHWPRGLLCMCSSVGGSAPILTGCGRRLFQGRLVTAINTRELTVNEITCAVCFRVYRRDLEQAMRVRAEPDRDGQHAEDGHHRRGGSRGQSMGEI